MCAVKPMPRFFFGSDGLIRLRMAPNINVTLSLALPLPV